MTELLEEIPALLSSHLVLVLVALGVACAVGVPLAMMAAPRPRLAVALVGVAGVVQTVPGLALLALMVPVLAATGFVRPFGFAPAVIALTLYALLPILRNAITGLQHVDASVVEAARGLGMSPWQVMRLVQLPLAAPVIAAGIRTAAVWTVGAATLATPVGQPSLGNDIFAGLQTRNYPMLLVGVAFAAGLALALDAILAGAERALAGRHPRRALWAAGVLVALSCAVVGLPALVHHGGRTPQVSSQDTPAARRTRVRVGGKTFTEQYILVELLRARLAAAGLEVEVVRGLGSTVLFDALCRGDVDTYVEYSGTLWSNVLKRPGSAPRWQVLAEVAGWLARERAVRSLGELGFDDAYALAVNRSVATRLGLHTLADLAREGARVSLGADYEFLSRPEWATVRKVYALDVARTVTYDPALLFDAVRRGDVDVISAFSSDGRIAADDLVVLTDPEGALPTYDAMVLLGPAVRNDARLVCALEGLHVTVEQMRRANAMVDRDHASSAQAARALLEGQPLADCATLPP